MNESYDKKKMIETLTDPQVLIILSELEEGNKESTYLAKKLQLSHEEIKKRLEYVIQHGFVRIIQEEGKTVFAADGEKLNKIMEMDENFSSVIDGLTELDQYLN